MGIVPAMAGDAWGEDDNSRRYDAFAQQYPGYQETSRDLIAVALPSAQASAADATVLDLACGTGAATREILAVLSPHGKVTGVDSSAAMLATAAAAVADPRVTWIQAPAESVHQHVSEPADAVICNSAIWQTDIAATAIAVRAAIRRGGRFAFNVPADLLEGDGARPPERYPALLNEMRAIARRDYGWTPRTAKPAPARQPLTRESIGDSVTAAGFDVELVSELSHPDTAESARAWLSIPIFTKDLLSGLPYADRMRILDAACQRLGACPTDQGRWVVFAARASR